MSTTHSQSTSTAPTHSSAPTSTSSSSSGLSKGALAGIVLGGLVALALVLVVALFFLKRARQRKESLEDASKETSGNTGSAPQGNYNYDALRPGNNDHYYQMGSSPNNGGFPSPAVTPRGAPIELRGQQEQRVGEPPAGLPSPYGR
ncbi:hypothetical protein BU24DRAFT_180704 [Aaosphaeria arxii CBS 175.79]|uniref:Mid2 domain-containing protein n=1 Tax=Aaosphaeria arxii CBS 175.79 TaxID=1450172 RepID=A0A6A5XRV9_9PLEO|nr:uncharacterized protein BU24DRAFT_180704 [Aaosphaeria arxii CBS 175.79]KAF2015577.1 hypothetical protein BU24DRAFT_180704 [Aaosphaeria arxii CBS 175.79]